MKLKKVLIQSAKPLLNSMPILIGIILLISLINAFDLFDFLSQFFTNNLYLDSLVGASLGSILAGNPVTSYILGGEMLKQGISLIAITAFLVSWVTVGIIQFPAEAMLLGRKFAILRNISSFILSIVVAILTVLFL